jgi:hypothetical protein
MVEGVSSVVRVMEERGWEAFEEDHNLQDDQVRWSGVASSCKSFDQGTVVAMADELVLGESDNDASVGGQVAWQGTKEADEVFHTNEKGSGDAFGLSVSRNDIPSLRQEDRVVEGDKAVGVSGKAEGVRGLTLLAESDGCNNLNSTNEEVGSVVGSAEADVENEVSVEVEVGPVQVGDQVRREVRPFPSGPILENTTTFVNGPQVIGPSEGVLVDVEGSGVRRGEGSKFQPMSEILDSLLKNRAAKHLHSDKVNQGLNNSNVSSHIEEEGAVAFSKNPS